MSCLSAPRKRPPKAGQTPSKTSVPSKSAVSSVIKLHGRAGRGNSRFTLRRCPCMDTFCRRWCADMLSAMKTPSQTEDVIASALRKLVYRPPKSDGQNITSNTTQAHTQTRTMLACNSCSIRHSYAHLDLMKYAASAHCEVIRSAHDSDYANDPGLAHRAESAESQNNA